MRVIRFDAATAVPIAEFGSAHAAATPLAHGAGEAHAYAVHIAPGGFIGPHVAGFDQLFLVVQGSGWASGADGERMALATGTGAFIHKGEVHAKGSEPGMVAVMLQVASLEVPVGQ